MRGLFVYGLLIYSTLVVSRLECRILAYIMSVTMSSSVRHSSESYGLNLTLLYLNDTDSWRNISCEVPSVLLDYHLPIPICEKHAACLICLLFPVIVFTNMICNEASFCPYDVT